MTVDLASTAPEVKPAAEEPDHTVYYSLGKLTWPSLCDASGWFDAQKMRLLPLPEQTFLLLVMSLARQGMVFLDAYPVRVFSPSGAESSYVLYAIGVSGRTGHRECLGYTCSDGSPKSWDVSLASLSERGLAAPISSSPLSFRT